VDVHFHLHFHFSGNAVTGTWPSEWYAFAMILEQLDDIFAQTLVGDYDDELPWKAVQTLRRIGSRAVFERAAEWCGSEDPLRRARGADVLAQIGRTSEHPDNNFPDECYLILSAVTERERDPLPLLSAIHALGHIGNPRAVPLVIANCGHENPDVRFAVACALGKFAEDPCAARALMALMHDVDDDVRDWATFGLGVLGDADSAEIREALLKRMTDLDFDVREEAFVALANRKEPRAVPALIAELNQRQISGRLREAAETFLGVNEQRTGWSPTDFTEALRKLFAL
jgi:HEAT repeat protein